MALHKDLSGANLHECKGTDTASANTVRIADGAGSASWTKVTASAMDTATVKNVNKFIMTVKVTDLASVSFVLLPVPQNCTLDNVTSVITAAISGGDAILTVTRAGAATIGTITIAAAGSGEGVIDTITAPANNTFTAPSHVKIACDGGPTGGTSDAYLALEFTLT